MKERSPAWSCAGARSARPQRNAGKAKKELQECCWHGRNHGKEETYNFSGPEDGKQHAVTGDNPWKSAAYTRGDSGVNSETVMLKDGTTLKNEMNVSADGDTVTVKASDGTNEVWERVKGGAAMAAGEKKGAGKAKTAPPQ